MNEVKIQGHIIGSTSRVLHPFCSKSTSCPFPEIQLFQNLTLKFQGQDHSSKSHSGSNINSHPFRFMSRPSHSWDMAISILDLSWKSKVKVMGEVKIQVQKECATSYRLTFISFHINQQSHSWATSISKFELEKLTVKVIVQGYIVCPTSIHIDFFSCQLTLSYLRYCFF